MADVIMDEYQIIHPENGLANDFARSLNCGGALNCGIALLST
jgi:hypothetical protein